MFYYQRSSGPGVVVSCLIHVKMANRQEFAGWVLICVLAGNWIWRPHLARNVDNWSCAVRSEWFFRFQRTKFWWLFPALDKKNRRKIDPWLPQTAVTHWKVHFERRQKHRITDHGRRNACVLVLSSALCYGILYAKTNGSCLFDYLGLRFKSIRRVQHQRPSFLPSFLPDVEDFMRSLSNFMSMIFYRSAPAN